MLGGKGWSCDPDACVKVSKDSLYYPLHFLTLSFSQHTNISLWDNDILLPLPSDSYDIIQKSLLRRTICVCLSVGGFPEHTEPFMAIDV